MKFVATFEGLGYTADSKVQTIMADKRFIVDAEEEAAARAYAERFANIGLNWDNGIGNLKSIAAAMPEDSTLPNLSGYEKIFPDR